MVLGTVPCDQYVAVEGPHGIQPAALLQLGHDIGEQRVEQSRVDRIEPPPSQGQAMARTWLSPGILLMPNSVSQFDRP